MDNPYAAPAAPVLTVEQTPLADRSPEQIRKLYHRSVNADAIAFLMSLGLVIMIGALFAVSKVGNPVGMLVIAGIGLFFLVTVIAIFKRAAPGRVLGIIGCCLMLLNFPIGTLIGILGIIAFAGAKELFGPNRIPRAVVKAAYKAMKAEAKAAKAAAKAAARAGR